MMMGDNERARALARRSRRRRFALGALYLAMYLAERSPRDPGSVAARFNYVGCSDLL